MENDERTVSDHPTILAEASLYPNFPIAVNLELTATSFQIQSPCQLKPQSSKCSIVQP